MHYLCEVIIPIDRAEDYDKAIGETLSRWDENDKDSYQAWWDWYQIGGRFSGAKLEAALDPDALKVFMEAIQKEKFTVSSVQMGKQELSPASQQENVDTIWRDHFPNTSHTCPLFSHYKDEGGFFPSDICTVSEVPMNYKVARLVIAEPHWDKKKDELQTGFMLTKQVWNGCIHQSTDWDGNVRNGIKRALEHYTKIEVTDNWLAITVDYHT